VLKPLSISQSARTISWMPIGMFRPSWKVDPIAVSCSRTHTAATAPSATPARPQAASAGAYLLLRELEQQQRADRRDDVEGALDDAEAGRSGS
jgi:hypothetical protein